jgi:hypothetical protein
VLLTGWLSFCPDRSLLCVRQEVSEPHWLAFFHCLDQSLALRSTIRECPLLAGFHLLSCQFLALHSSGGKCPSLVGFLSPVQPFCISKVWECARWGKDGHAAPPPSFPTECESKHGAGRR